jgi:hypothetical protein
MFSRLSQIARHLSRPNPNYAHRAAASLQATPYTSSIMAATSSAQKKGLIHTAACLIIGDEVLGGKVRRTSARMGCIGHVLTRQRRRHAPADCLQAYLAKFCFSAGINLKRIEVIADDEGEIVEAVRRMSKNYDFVVTSGGIGPTYVMF